MRIHFDSRNTDHKTPFGTLRRGDLCQMNILIPHDCGAVAVGLIVEDCDMQFCREIPFAPGQRDQDYQSWQGSFTFDCGLYFYWFRIYKKDGSFRLFKQGSRTNMELGDKWQLSVIPEDLTVPDYAEGAVMYQILPDRFCKVGDCDLWDKLQPFTLHEDWYELPRYGPDEEGHWNNDFFGGNFRGIQEKLPYLQELGVGVLYLNPVVMAFSSHRYDAADYKRPDPMLGTEQDFRELCQAAHERGIRVILDGVFSHTGDHSIYFDARRTFGGGAVSDPDSPYVSWYQFKTYPHDYEAWWGIKTLPCVNELDPGFLHYIIDGEDSVAAYWLGLGADGFRLDVADELPDAFILRLKKRIRQLKPDALLLGEVWEDASNKRAYGVSRRYFVDGELDSVMNYPWREAILDFVMEKDGGEGFAERVMSLAENYPPQVLRCLMNLLGSHDKPRILTVLGDDFQGSKEEKAHRRLNGEQYELARQRLMLAAFLQYTLPGMPSIYYGDEAGLEGFEDPYCRRTYPWGREDALLRDFYRGLGRMKKTHAALRKGDIRIRAAGQGRLHFLRSLEEQSLHILVNRTGEPWTAAVRGTAVFGRALQIMDREITLLPGGFCLIEETP